MTSRTSSWVPWAAESTCRNTNMSGADSKNLTASENPGILGAWKALGTSLTSHLNRHYIQLLQNLQV